MSKADRRVLWVAILIGLVAAVALCALARAHDLDHASDPGPSLLPAEPVRPVTNIYLTVAAGQGGR